MFDKTNITIRIEPYRAAIQAYILSLRDVRNVGILVFTVIVLLISWSGVKSIQTNYGLQKQVAQLQQENRVQSLENSDLGLQNNYFSTKQYVELTARANLGLGEPGETELIMPESVALAHTVKQPSSISAASEVPKQSFWEQNFRAWTDFFMHRNADAN
jgi:cell division protein FtsB